MTKNTEYANALYGDPDVHQLLALGARHHALHICTPREINVSRLIAWLLDPNEGHGLGDKALRSLLAQAGRSENAANLDLKTHRFLEPAKVHNLALSSLIVKTELNVLAKLKPAKGKATAAMRPERKRDLLDIVAVDPGLQLCVAIENKFGAAERPTQLQRYLDGLATLFPKYTRIHIFLDKRDEVPGHGQWLGVGYGWLSEFLRAQEQNPSVAQEVKRVLSEFREAVQQQDEEAANATLASRLITEVASRHQEAIDAMWEISKRQNEELFLQQLANLAGISTLDGQAALSLFQLFHRSPDIWTQCKNQARFARFYKKLREQFTDVQDDVKQVKAFFSLEEWGQLIDVNFKDEYVFPAGVRVHARGGSFRITTYMHLVHTRPSQRDALMKVVEAARKAEGRQRPKKGAEWFDLYQRDLAPEAAVQEVLSRMTELQSSLKPLL